MSAAKKLAKALREDGQAKVIADAKAGKQAEAPYKKNPDAKPIGGQIPPRRRPLW